MQPHLGFATQVGQVVERIDDAAYGGPAILSEAGRTALAGIHRVDSIAIDPHK